MRRLFVGAVVLSVFLIGIAPAKATGEYAVIQKTLDTSGSITTTLTSEQKAQIKVAVESTSQAEKFICTGIRLANASRAENIRLRALAKEACDYAKSLNPSLSTWSQSKVTKSASYAGKVLLTVKSAVAPSSPQADVCVDVSRTETNTAMCEIANANVETISLQKLHARVKVASTGAAKVNLYVSSDLASEKNRFLDETQDAIDFHGVDFKAKEIQVLVFTPAQINWARSTWAEVSRGTLNQMVVLDQVTSASCGPNGMKIGGQAIGKESAGEMRYYFLMCFADKNDSLDSAEFLAHELTHLVQMSHYQTAFFGFPRVEMPVWLAEGAATFTGSIALTQAEHRQIVGRGLSPEFVKLIREGSNQTVVDLYKQLETTQNQASTAWKSYFLGGLASEQLVAAFGYEKLALFQQSFATSSNVSENFQKVYGFPIADFYLRAAEYVRYVIQTRVR